MAPSGAFRCFPMFSGVSGVSGAVQCFPVFSGVFRCFPMRSGVFRHRPAQPSRGFPMFSGAAQCFPVLSGAAWRRVSGAVYPARPALSGAIRRRLAPIWRRLSGLAMCGLRRGVGLAWAAVL